jgi:dihydrofolate reductase
MRKVIVHEWMTLDGVVQAPGEAGEDKSGGFAHGGWHMPYFDDLSMKWTFENVTSAGGYLLGRRTYEIFAAHWPNAGEEEQALAEPLNTRPKYVASTTLSEPLEWQNSTLLHGDVGEAVAALKQEDGGDLHLFGSTELVRDALLTPDSRGRASAPALVQRPTVQEARQSGPLVSTVKTAGAVRGVNVDKCWPRVVDCSVKGDRDE